VVKQIPHVSEIDQGLHAPTKIPKDIKMIKEDAAPPPATAGVAGMSGMAGGVPGGIMGGMPGGTGSGPAIVVAKPKPTGPARISSGVVAGLKQSGATPVYPAIARAAHQSGQVVLHAVISKSGAIENLTVISGPAMLQGAALEAVKTWRYKPYVLNGEPTEVDTTITVNFNLNGG
jgi:protein TonB